MNKLELMKMANEVRKGVVTAVFNAKSGHPGGSLSAADIYTYLFFEEMNIDPQEPKKADRDRFVLSKGHTAPGYYSTLANRGFFPVEDLTTNRLGTEKLGKLIMSMALPAVAAQLVNVLYNIVDRIYIGHIEGYGDLALTGVGIAFPIITLITAFSSFAGMGGAPLASMKLGRKDYDGAEKILGNSAAMLLLFAVTLTTVFMVFKTPILYAFGASSNTIEYAEAYISIYLIGTIFVQFALGLNTFISGQGNAKVAMLSVCLGACVNIVLDPIMIFVL